jgi:hypothetical protein
LGEIKNEYQVLVGKHVGKRQLERPELKKERDI